MKSTLSMIGVGAAMLLAGCHPEPAANGDVQAGDSKFCTPFKTNATVAPSAVGDPAGAFDDCIHRWGYALASSRDPADVVAQATVNACSSILQTWSEQLQGQGAGPQGAQDEGQQQPTAAQQQIRIAEARALFYVVQARAGNCAAPPANTLVAPAGATGSN